MSSFRLLACVSLTAMLLCGCGQTGPLVYPEKPSNSSDNQATTE